MRTILDKNNLPGRLLRAEVVIDSGRMVSPGEAIMISRSNMARQLAGEILAQDDFFKTTGYGPGGDVIGIEANVIVLTPDQLMAFGMRCYRDGKESWVLG